MRTLNKNKQDMKYVLYNASSENYETTETGETEYMVIDGVSVPIKQGSISNTYSAVFDMKANIAFGGDSEVQAYGINVGDYDAVVVTDKDKYPLGELSLIWYESTPAYLDNEHTIVDPESADYTVKAVLPSLNYKKFVLKRKVKDNEVHT